MKNAFIFILFSIFACVNESNAQTQTWPLKMGKYSCTASKYVNGAFEFIPRGSIVLSKEKKYSYNGFEKPSSGTYTVDQKGNILFKGGFLDGGKAEKTDRIDRFLLVFPSNPDNRWTMSIASSSR